MMRHQEPGGGRRRALAAVALAILAAPLAAGAQARKVRRIGLLVTVPRAFAPTRAALELFRQSLRDLGHVEGESVAFEYRFADGGLALLPELAADLVRLGVDIIVTDTSDAARAAMRATTTVPIVMAVSSAPVEQGLVASLARPGGNVTGSSMLAEELAMKRLELLKQLVPRTTRVVVLRPPAGLGSEFAWRHIEGAARHLGLKLQALEMPRAEGDIERAFDAALAGGADALIALPDPVIVRYNARLAALVARHRLPAMFFERTAVEAGVLVSYGPSIPEMFVRAASFVDRILKGARPADLPVELPAKFELILNLTTAQALGLAIPASILALADDVIR